MSKIKYLATILLVALVWFFQPLVGKYGQYNPTTGTLWCTADWSCRHEVGHSMDWDLGNPSQDPKFLMATRLYMINEYRTNTPDELAGWLMLQDKTSLELYADLYQHIDGDVDSLPAILQPYYSQSAKYQRLYGCLIQNPVQVCGRALRLAVGRNTQDPANTTSLVVPSR